MRPSHYLFSELSQSVYSSVLPEDLSLDAGVACSVVILGDSGDFLCMALSTKCRLCLGVSDIWAVVRR